MVDMHWFSIEHSRWAYRADFALYALATVGLLAFLVISSPVAAVWELLASMLAGLLVWTGLEYLLHRFVLHGVAPFSDWHAQHHARPRALICTPTWLSAGLIAGLVFLPAWAWGSSAQASALTLGLLLGYQAYAVMHHAIHHAHSSNRWLLHCRQWHGLHHQAQSADPGCYGVTSRVWDHLCGSNNSAAEVGLPAHRRPKGQHLKPRLRRSAHSTPSPALRRQRATEALKPTESKQ